MSSSRVAAVFLLGAITGVLLIGLVRFFLQAPKPATHYHANWAVYVDGQRLDLSADRYMEDVARCKLDPSTVAPEERVHMHNNDHDAVHVHDAGATWGHLAANLGFGIGDDYLVIDGGRRLFADDARTLKFIVDGAPVHSIQNRVVRRGERLLISFGGESSEEVVRTQFPTVAATGPELDRSPDPGGCGGAAGVPVGERLRRAFFL